MDLFASVQQMHGIAGAGIGTVEETIHVHQPTVNETDRLQSLSHGAEISPSHENIDILSVPHSSSIYSSNPGSNGVSTGHRVRNPSVPQGACSTQCSFANRFHGFNHPLPGKGLQCNGQFGISKSCQLPVAEAKNLVLGWLS
jgi:hypothetical protein